MLKITILNWWVADVSKNKDYLCVSMVFFDKNDELLTTFNVSWIKKEKIFEDVRVSLRKFFKRNIPKENCHIVVRGVDEACAYDTNVKKSVQNLVQEGFGANTQIMFSPLDDPTTLKIVADELRGCLAA